MKKHIGRVRWFNASRGYGFLTEESSEKDIFVHYSAIQVPGYKVLNEGQRVLFEMTQGERGPIARNVVPVENDTAHLN